MKPPKLHVRDLFWLTLVVAVCCGWISDSRRHAAIHQRDIDERQKDLSLLEQQVYLGLSEAEERYKEFRPPIRCGGPEWSMGTDR